MPVPPLHPVVETTPGISPLPPFLPRALTLDERFAPVMRDAYRELQRHGVKAEDISLDPNWDKVSTVNVIDQTLGDIIPGQTKVVSPPMRSRIMYTVHVYSSHELRRHNKMGNPACDVAEQEETVNDIVVSRGGVPEFI